MFAHCERSNDCNTIMLWRWKGTSSNLNEPAMGAVASFRVQPAFQVEQLGCDVGLG